MAMKFFLVLACLISLKSFGQTIDLSEGWLFKTGDSISWSNISYNAKGWHVMKRIGSLEENGLGNYDGYFWVRKNFVIPSSIKAKVFKAGKLNLFLGKIDDADQTYFNGFLVGSTGNMPPNYEGKYDRLRVYTIDYKLIKWDVENVIAVRIYDAAGGGGFWGKRFSLELPANMHLTLTNKNIPGYKPDNGFAAYKIKLPISSTQKLNAQRFEGLIFKLPIEGAASCFFNSVFIGKSLNSGKHSFFIPYPMLKSENEVIVFLDEKVNNEQLYYFEPVLVAEKRSWSDILNINTVGKKEIDCKMGKELSLDIKLSNSSKKDFRGTLNIEIATDINNITETKTQKVVVSKNNKKMMHYTFKPTFAGIYTINYSFKELSTGETLKGNLIRGEILE